METDESKHSYDGMPYESIYVSEAHMLPQFFFSPQISFFSPWRMLNQHVIRWRMEASVSENKTAARQQKTDANYLPMAAGKQNILWHLLCLSRAAADAKEI